MGQNRHRSIIQTVSQSSNDKEILHSPPLLSFSPVLPLSNSLPFSFFFKAKKAHFLYFKHQPHKPISKAQINSLCFNNPQHIARPNIQRPIKSFFIYFLLFIFICLFFISKFFFFFNTQINLLTPIRKFNFLNFINNQFCFFSN